MILNDIERAVICGKQEYRTNADFIDAIEAAVIAKLCAGVEMPEPISYVSFNRQGDISRIIKRKDSWTNTPVFTADQLRTCIAAARVKAYAAAGASPMKPSESVEHRDELAKRKPEPAAETVGGLAKAVKAARGGDAPPAPMRRFA